MQMNLQKRLFAFKLKNIQQNAEIPKKMDEFKMYTQLVPDSTITLFGYRFFK